MLTSKEVWLIQMYSTQRGGRRPEQEEKISCLIFSCLAIKYAFYLINIQYKVFISKIYIMGIIYPVL